MKAAIGTLVYFGVIAFLLMGAYHAPTIKLFALYAFVSWALLAVAAMAAWSAITYEAPQKVYPDQHVPQGRFSDYANVRDIQRGKAS